MADYTIDNLGTTCPAWSLVRPAMADRLYRVIKAALAAFDDFHLCVCVDLNGNVRIPEGIETLRYAFRSETSLREEILKGLEAHRQAVRQKPLE